MRDQGSRGSQQATLHRLLQVEAEAQVRVRQAEALARRWLAEAEAQAQRLVAEARDQAEAEAQALSQPVLAEAEEESGCVPTGGVSAVTGPLEQHLVEATALLVAWVIGEER